MGIRPWEVRTMILYQWECPDCESVTNGATPDAICPLCGQSNIVRNLTAEEEETDNEAMLEMSVATQRDRQKQT